MKILRLGDPHVRVSNLEESERLMQFVLRIATEQEADRLEILGDLFDTHSLVRLEVLEFWQNWLMKLVQQPFQTVVLVGNHDISGGIGNNYSSLSPFRHLVSKGLVLVDRPTLLDKYGYLPYFHDRDEYVKQANLLAEQGANFLVSHTTYTGAKYDNGMYAPDGVEPDKLSPKFVNLLSGHIHTESQFGRVIYPGTARWATASDANKRKGIVLYQHAEDASILKSEFFSTENICTQILSYEIHEGEVIPELVPGAKIHLELVGSSDWITKIKKEVRGSCTVSSRITDAKKSRARKSGKSLYEFVSNHFETQNRNRLMDYLKELKLV